ncbi:hypothetical protein COS55_02895 [Candidatus Shapirobacteria bacterium CG03_land_8_20_14_0_80_40_19]|uniref:Phosphoglycerate kinase n=4 Tax=Candidatus Shapironibacteriota TaxID=1752721 RepID=A0A2M7BCL5_9BACT|nr:MAG: hypothetical protein COV89_02940 [Candidatus Shapirobacteria bacterium CG11_big_fil_rev_8_21_14_0_20_40_12]PIV00847.1 MAG: hypothetical protein COS55_02895 [Candidatus Shapirobacteria bacterium CG03_land_8_20_14_0_80_40_19]PJC28601.1 MAG: hypothetical protein CO053_03685 [Candidatus Shapirobacteria bacterium CG_4_9_14_0_2_um_filter_40_11]PJC77023.1 MAG: hypothetical protein CO010_01125 [Candidatus Shapirobacteria bacterium CG_4_8_14_3_um_filter_39_11]
MILPQLKDFNFYGKKVLVRCDFDGARLEENLPAVKYLLDNGAKKIILMGHLGRPEGRVVEDLKLAPVEKRFRELLDSKNIIFLENLRFDKREEENDAGFAKELAGLGDFYVNEAFASSHRQHASIVGIPKFLPHCAGFHFASEVENLSKILENPKRPLVFVIGGDKLETKLPLVVELAHFANSVLVGGALTQNMNINNVLFAKPTDDGFDISDDSIMKFGEIIKKAGTVVWNGPMGKFEDEKWEMGTRKIAEAIAGCGGFRVVGGGDTISALKKFNLIDKMDYVSTGGGAMLEFLAKGTLPGIEALENNKN